MTTEYLAFAEKALDEMLLAEKMLDYPAFVKWFDKSNLDDFDEATFRSEVESINQDLGTYKSRRYLGVVKGNPQVKGQRFVWDCKYEKGHSIVVVGIYEKNGELIVSENMNY